MVLTQISKNVEHIGRYRRKVQEEAGKRFVLAIKRGLVRYDNLIQPCLVIGPLDSRIRQMSIQERQKYLYPISIFGLPYLVVVPFLVHPCRC